MNKVEISPFLFKEEGYQIIGACMDVHKQLGCGFLEAVYHEALGIELTKRNVPFEKEKKLNIYYREQLLEKSYRADIVCYDKIIIEIKATSELTSEHTAQLLNYLAATQLKVGYLINFGTPSLQYKRLIK
jgi:GxxExxY protein